MVEKSKRAIARYIERGGRYFGTDMMYLAKGGSWLTFGHIASGIFGFVSLIAFSNLLSQETYGVYRFVLSFTSTLAIFMLPGVSTAIIQSVSRQFDGSFWKGFKLKMLFGIGTTVSAFAIAIYYYLNENTMLALSFVVLGAFLPLMQTLFLYRAVLVGKKDFKTMSLYDVVTRIVLLVTLVTTLFLTQNVVVILLVYFVSYIVIRFVFLRRTVKRHPLNKEEDAQTISYAKHLSVQSALSLVAEQLDKVIIFHFLGAAPLAIYALAVTPVDQLGGLLKNVRSLALPKFSASRPEDLQETLGAKVRKMEYIIAPLVILYVVLAPFIFKIAFPQYLDSVVLSQVLSLLLLFVPRSLFTTALKAQMKTKELYIFRIVSPLLRIGFVLGLVIPFGLWGAVWAAIITEFCKYFLSFWLFKKI